MTATPLPDRPAASDAARRTAARVAVYAGLTLVLLADLAVIAFTTGA